MLRTYNEKVEKGQAKKEKGTFIRHEPVYSCPNVIYFHALSPSAVLLLQERTLSLLVFASGRACGVTRSFSQYCGIRQAAAARLSYS
jgi:hypothetical protein